MAIMAFDPDSKEMFLKGCFPGISPLKIQACMEFEVDTTQAIDIEPPSKDELRILREVCDPQRLILGV
jgi:glutaconate CoA-transferase subunit B